MEQAEGFIILHLENMGVACDEELWRTSKERGADAWVVTAGITTDMLNEHINIFALKAVQFAIHKSQITTVAVAADGTEWAESRQALSHFYRTDVAGMPYLVAGFEVMQILLVPKRVGVAENSDSFHCGIGGWELMGTNGS